MRALLIAAAWMLLGAAAPAPPPEAADAVARIERLAEAARAGAKSRVERAVVEADLAFAADARAMGVSKAFEKWAAPTGKLVTGGASVPTGPAAIAAEFPPDSFGWWWSPTEVHAAGDVGVTAGEAVIVGADAGGEPRITRTRYVTAWRKTKDGWRFVLDMGTPIRE